MRVYTSMVSVVVARDSSGKNLNGLQMRMELNGEWLDGISDEVLGRHLWPE